MSLQRGFRADSSTQPQMVVFPGRRLVRRREESSGAVSFDVSIMGRPYVFNVPRRNTPGAESLCVREWLFSRLAREMGLPVLTTLAVEVEARELSLRTASGELHLPGRAVFPGTRQFGTRTPQGSHPVSWQCVEPIHRVLLWLWVCATSVSDASGRLASMQGPGAFLPTEEADDEFGHGYVMLDCAGASDLWEQSLQGVFRKCPSAWAAFRTLSSARQEKLRWPASRTDLGGAYPTASTCSYRWRIRQSQPGFGDSCRPEWSQVSNAWRPDEEQQFRAELNRPTLTFV